MGLDRPYDAVPDQDLLWLKESQRILSGLEVTYPDHPGAFWTLLYSLNLKFLLGHGFSQKWEAISEIAALKAINIARIENISTVALVSIFSWPLYRVTGASRKLSALLVSSHSISMGSLLSIVQIRHEAISVLFLLFYVDACLLALSLPETRTRKYLGFFAAVFIIIAAYCKVQALILVPFALLLVLWRYCAMSNFALRFNALNICFSGKHLFAMLPTFITFFFAGIFLWFASVSGYILMPLNRYPHMRADIDLGFWTLLIFSVLIVSSLVAFGRLPGLRDAIIYGFAYASLVVMCSRTFMHPLWTSQVFGFPSVVIPFAKSSAVGSSVIMASLYSFSRYWNELFWGFSKFPMSSLLLSLLALVVVSILGFTARCSTPEYVLHVAKSSLPFLFLIVLWFLTGLRFQYFYTVYLFLPTSLVLVWSANRNFSSSLTSRIAILISLLLIASLCTRSISNLASFSYVSSYRQDRGNLCIGQAYDRLMRNLTVSSCPDF